MKKELKLNKTGIFVLICIFLFVLVLSFYVSATSYNTQYYSPSFQNYYSGRGINYYNYWPALENADLKSKDIDYICSNANSTVLQDKIEAKVIKEVFGKYASKIPVSAIKSMIGECYSVSGALAVAASLGSLNDGFIPPTANYKEPDSDCDLNIVKGKAVKADLKNILVTNFGPGSAYVCMVLRKV